MPTSTGFREIFDNFDLCKILYPLPLLFSSDFSVKNFFEEFVSLETNLLFSKELPNKREQILSNKKLGLLGRKLFMKCRMRVLFKGHKL